MRGNDRTQRLYQSSKLTYRVRTRWPEALGYFIAWGWGYFPAPAALLADGTDATILMLQRVYCSLLPGQSESSV
ncbi:hypothetical protein HNQ77_002214 [Silvibacterium bohemicum]|uniref:Uncharacterized protein n=1 Tax=Silvibacterium bohemicum TaxID=1577686 RepID=A0A841JS92_9BACT|nr:hypothetical protein [Silvibacterium bohemicum]